MAQYVSLGKLLGQPVHKFSHCVLLLRCAIVHRLATCINATNVTDVDAVMVVPFHPVAGFRDWPVLNHLAVPFNDKMITGRLPVQHLFMVSVNAVCRGRYVAGRGVQNDVVNWSHLQMGLLVSGQPKVSKASPLPT